MPTISNIAATPRYVLLEGKDPIGPGVIPGLPECKCLAVYGFSGKSAYDRFAARTDRELRPYPLMKGYLQKEAAAGGDELRLVVLDADGPVQQSIVAVTMNSAFVAQSNSSAQVAPEYQLTLDPQSTGYRLSESST